MLDGSFIVFSCNNGFINTGGSLTVTCGSNGSWSPFPNCVSNPQATTASTTSGVVPGPTTSSQTSTNCADVPSIPNGFVANATALQQNNMILSRTVEYSCKAGFVRLETSGQQRVSCTDGRWSPLPVCIGTSFSVK